MSEPASDPSQQDLDDLVAEIRSSRRYRGVSEELVRRVVSAERTAARDRRSVVKATKRKLHQAVRAFGGEPPYQKLLEAHRSAFASGTETEREAACLQALRRHASTRERIPLLEDFYRRVFAVTGAPRTILDLGCGLNPLALPWMRLSREVEYRAYDADEELVEFVRAFLTIAGARGGAEARDVLARPPERRADVALLMKLVPTLERQEPGGSLRLLDALDVSYVVVSVPTRSLGGREKGMLKGYERQVGRILASRPWTLERIPFEHELVWVVRKP